VESSVNRADDHEIYGGRLCTNHCTNHRFLPICPGLIPSLAWLTMSTDHHTSDTVKILATANLSKPRAVTCMDEDLLGLLTDGGCAQPAIPSVFGLSAGTSETAELAESHRACEAPLLQKSIACPESSGGISPVRHSPAHRPTRKGGRASHVRFTREFDANRKGCEHREDWQTKRSEGVDKPARLRLTLVIATEHRSDGHKDRVYLKWMRPLGGALTVRPGPFVT
jgi:hypothetical protein